MTQDKKEVDFEVEKIESEEEKVTRSEQGWMHTDLAVELRESFSGDGGEIPGVAVEDTFRGRIETDQSGNSG